MIAIEFGREGRLAQVDKRFLSGKEVENTNKLLSRSHFFKFFITKIPFEPFGLNSLTSGCKN